MILEHALLNVIAGQALQFEQDFRRAESIISKSPGYLGHTLLRGIEKPSQYLLLVKWRSLEDHTRGFRESPNYQDWKELLHHYYEPFPTVEHFDLADKVGAARPDLSI